jgi:hypothetical protein
MPALLLHSPFAVQQKVGRVAYAYSEASVYCAIFYRGLRCSTIFFKVCVAAHASRCGWPLCYLERVLAIRITLFCYCPCLSCFCESAASVQWPSPHILGGRCDSRYALWLCTYTLLYF